MSHEHHCFVEALGRDLQPNKRPAGDRVARRAWALLVLEPGGCRPCVIQASYGMAESAARPGRQAYKVRPCHRLTHLTSNRVPITLCLALLTRVLLFL